MSKTRLFLSHSWHAPANAPRLRAVVARLEELGYEVLVDYTAARKADEWRRVVHELLAECDAAAILFSKEALDSEWVLKESTILSYRRALDPTFPLLPVLLDGVTRAELEAKNYRLLLLNELQQQQRTATHVDEIVAHITEAVGPARPTQTLLDQLIGDVAGVLSDVDYEALRRACETHIADVKWRVSLQRERAVADVLARAMLRSGAGFIDTAVQIFDSLGIVVDPAIPGRVIGALAPMWVDPQAAAQIPVANLRKESYRDLVLCGRYSDFTPRMHVARAYPRSRRPLVVSVADDTGGKSDADVTRVIRTTLRKIVPVLQTKGDAEVDRQINEILSAPLFVVLPWLPDADMVSRLRGRYPKATFMFCCGQELGLVAGPTAAAAAAALPPEVRPLDPPLLPEEEERAYMAWFNAQAFLGNTTG
jgi:hypothetical protein